MARTKSLTWTVIICLLLGGIGATIFWLYTPYGHDQLAQQVAADLKSQPLPQKGGGPLSLKKLASQASGSRFQMVANGKDTFVVDLKEGRVWRYFHETGAAGANRGDEGFLPMPFYYAGKKHYTASEIAPPSAANPGNPATPAPQEKKPQ
jgi:hypothetical protein